MAKELAPRPYVAVDARYGSYKGELKIPYKTWLQTQSRGTDPEILKSAQGHVVHRLLGSRARNGWINFDEIAFDQNRRLVWGNYQTITATIKGEQVSKKKFIEKDPPYESADFPKEVEPPVLEGEKMKITRQRPEEPEQDTLFDTAEFEPVNPYSGAGHYRMD